jgi:hypothetical protein
MENAFIKVKDYLLTNCKFPIEKIIDSTEPFVMDYVKCPVGYAETDNLNDTDELFKEIDEHFTYLALEDGRVRRGLINHIIRKETRCWNVRNAGYYGRHIARLAYLLK